MRIDTGTILSRTFSTFGRNFGPFLVLAVIVYLPYMVLAVALQLSTLGGASPDPESVEQLAETMTPLLVTTLVLLFVQIIMGFVLTGAVAHGVFRDLQGRRVTVSEALSIGFQRLFPVIGVAIVSSIVIFLGLFLLIVGAFIFMCMLYVAAPAVVVERPGVFGALSRSAELTRGYRWHVFLVVVVLGLLGGIVGVVADGLALAAPVVGLVFQIVVQALAGLLGAVAQGVTYHDLRVAKEGASTQDLVAVFE